MKGKKNPKPDKKPKKGYPLRVDLEIWNKWVAVMPMLGYRDYVDFIRDMVTAGIEAKTKKVSPHNMSHQPEEIDVFWAILENITRKPGIWTSEKLKGKIPCCSLERIENILGKNPEVFEFVDEKGWSAVDILDKSDDFDYYNPC